jgi:hypothetical protein
VQVRGTVQFTATVEGSGGGVDWSVAEGTTGGEISPDGLYSAPDRPGVYHVVARSQADATKSGSATVSVAPNSESGVSVSPRGATVPRSGTKTFTCIVDDAPSDACDWSVLEGSSGGSVTASGVYTAPSESGLYHVVATAQSDSSKTGTAAIWVSPPGAGTPGTWENVVTDGNPTAFGFAGSLVVDPMRPNDYYAFVETTVNNGPMKVIKSTDYGKTWEEIGATAINGNPWGSAIDPNPERDPSTPPVLYTPAGYGSAGVWKSLDGGVNWYQIFSKPNPLDPYSPFNTSPPDIYYVAVLPDNPPNHIIVTYHGYWKDSGDAGFAESTDGGATWVIHEPPTGIGQSHYIMTPDPNTWISIGQENAGGSGMWRTTTAGRSGGNISKNAWTNVDPLEHLHGSFQHLILDGGDSIYAPGYHGIKRSSDRGATWSSVYQTGGYMTAVVATDTYLYANNAVDANLLRARRDADTTWETYGETPSGYTKGASPYGTATSTDGTRWFMLIAAQGTGVWRYVE